MEKKIPFDSLIIIESENRFQHLCGGIDRDDELRCWFKDPLGPSTISIIVPSKYQHLLNKMAELVVEEIRKDS